ncbi:unnamed protein product [Cylindrotheca closterium]|uniref:Helicase-associated domain-containing protein n=1 Tax=Cylindrotheca closterium TaxID=2856 RepID=A0AAD2GC40_9STRA|nr:unnamed protein product [Cylindrotheca closterium]
MLNINTNFPGAMDNKLRLTTGCSESNFQPEVCRWIDPFPLTHAMNLSYRDDKEFDLGSILDYVPSSTLVDQSTENKSIQENVLKRPIIQIEDNDYENLNSRASRFKRHRTCNDVAISSATDVFPADATSSAVDVIPDASIVATGVLPDVEISAADVFPDVATTAADLFPDVATSAAAAHNVTPEVEGYPRFRNHQEKQWQKQFQALLEFKQKHGHCCVPNKYDENPVLGRWVKRQRYQHKLLLQQGKKSTLVPHRVKALEDAGFIWDSHSALWEERLNELKAYRRAHGHSNVPSTCTANAQLSTWVKCQRRQYKLFLEGDPSSNLSPERISALNKIGFQWCGRLARRKGTISPSH